MIILYKKNDDKLKHWVMNYKHDFNALSDFKITFLNFIDFKITFLNFFKFNFYLIEIYSQKRKLRYNRLPQSRC
jgi:hypothetical protein